jgi:hypothetical protein
LRRHDFQPPSGANDIGRMVFDTPDRLLEHGVEADYFEIWERVSASNGENSAHRLSANPLCLVLETGPFFMLVRPRAMKLPQGARLADFAAGMSDHELRQMVDFEISFGRRFAKRGSGQIELSTLPWRQGREVPDR